MVAHLWSTFAAIPHTTALVGLWIIANKGLWSSNQGFMVYQLHLLGCMWQYAGTHQLVIATLEPNQQTTSSHDKDPFAKSLVG